MPSYRGVTGGRRYMESSKTFHEGGFETTNLAAADASGIVEVRENNSKAIADAIDKALAAALEEIGLVAESYAKKECPVDTGRLRNSITHVARPQEKAVYIGTNVEYAQFVEEDSDGGRRRGHHFLRNAAADHSDKYRQIVESRLRNG